MVFQFTCVSALLGDTSSFSDSQVVSTWGKLAHMGISNSHCQARPSGTHHTIPGQRKGVKVSLSPPPPHHAQGLCVKCPSLTGGKRRRRWKRPPAFPEELG